MPVKKLLTAHEKFTTLFDREWSKSKSTIRNRCDDDKSYDPSYSWDGRSDNPVEFTRLQATQMPVQHTRPVTLSGSAVVELEPHTGFEVLNVIQENRTKGHIPLTAEQIDVGMAKDLSATVPMKLQAASASKDILMEAQPAFKNNDLRPPQFTQTEKPQYMIDAGPMWDQVLLAPAQRREILDYEKRNTAANLYIKKAEEVRGKMKKQIAGLMFHRGVVGIDTCDNEESEIYGNKAKQVHTNKEYKAQIHLERKANLALRTSSLSTHGNILVPSSLMPRVKTESYYQGKGGNVHTLSFDETHSRLFCRGAERPAGGVRTQWQRDNDLGGKEYNFINHTIIEQWPSRHVERLADKRMLHPSQTSLHTTRNFVGAVIKHDRLI